LGPLGTAVNNWPLVPAPGDYDDGEIGGTIGRGNRSTRRKPALVPLCQPQTSHAARTRTQDAAVGSQRLTPLSYGTALLSLSGQSKAVVEDKLSILGCYYEIFYLIKKHALENIG
jgi:hypothetical protein